MDLLDELVDAVDVEKHIKWCESYLNDYHMEEPFESTIVTVCVDLNNTSKTKRFSDTIEISDRSLRKYGRDLVKKKGAAPLAYFMIHQGYAIIDKEDVERFSSGKYEDGETSNIFFSLYPHEGYENAEVYTISSSLLGRGIQKLLAYKIQRDPTGRKFEDIGKPTEMSQDNGDAYEGVACEFWEGASQALLDLK